MSNTIFYLIIIVCSFFQLFFSFKISDGIIEKHYVKKEIELKNKQSFINTQRLLLRLSSIFNITIFSLWFIKLISSTFMIILFFISLISMLIYSNIEKQSHM